MNEKTKPNHNLYKELRNFSLAAFVLYLIVMCLVIHVIVSGVYLRLDNPNQVVADATTSHAIIHSYIKWGTSIFFIVALEIAGLIVNAFGIIKANKISHEDNHQSELYILWIITLVLSFFILAWISSFILFFWLNKEYKDHPQEFNTNTQLPAVVQ